MTQGQDAADCEAAHRTTESEQHKAEGSTGPRIDAFAGNGDAPGLIQAV